MDIEELKTKVKVKLPPILDAYQAEQLYQTMMKSLSMQKAVEVDAENVERMDTLCAQIILSSRIDCDSQNISFRIKSHSKATKKTFETLGLAHAMLSNEKNKEDHVE